MLLSVRSVLALVRLLPHPSEHGWSRTTNPGFVPVPILVTEYIPKKNMHAVFSIALAFKVGSLLSLTMTEEEKQCFSVFQVVVCFKIYCTSGYCIAPLDAVWGNTCCMNSRNL